MAAMVAMEPTPLGTALATVMAATARGLLTPRLMPTMAMEAMVDMDLAMEATAMAGLATAMEDTVDTVSATPLATVLATAMVVTARGLRTLRLMPTTAMEDMVDTVLVTPLATVLATDTAV